MKKIFTFLLILSFFATKSFALIEIDITRGNLDPLPIAVSPLHVDIKSEDSDGMKIKELGENISKIIQESSNDSSHEEKDIKAKNNVEEKDKSNSETWIRVIMKESTEVNGGRFPEGIQIDVTEDDSKKLIETGKAEIIS